MKSDADTKNRPSKSEDESESDNDEEEIIAEAVIVPPDGDWGWVIVAASFFSNLVVDGIIFTAGQGFLSIWAKQFTAGKAGVAAWVVSLLSGCYLLVGPLVSAVANTFGCRITAMVGTILGAIGFLLSMFATNIWFLYFSFGLLGGVGLGFIYLPSIVIVSYYFEKKRALATGMAVCGSGIGTFVFAPFINFLLSIYTWQETMLIMSGVILNCLVFAALYKKLTPTKQQLEKLEEKLCEYEEEKERKMTTGQKHHHDRRQVTNGRTVTEKAPENSPLLPGNVEFERFPGFEDRSHVKRRTVSVGQRIFKSTMDLDTYRKQSGMRRQDTCPEDPELLRAVGKRSMVILNRPLSRMDIFYAGSVHQLPEFKSQPDVRRFLASTLSIPGAVGVDGAAAEKTAPDGGADAESAPVLELSTRSNIKNTLLTILDFSLFKSPSFIILALSGFFTFTGFFVPFTYLRTMAESFGHSSDKSMFLVSLLGITNVVARIFCGWLSDRPQTNALMINNVALIFAGLATAIVPHCRSYALLCIYCLIFGMGTACFACLRSVICVELLGLEKLTNAFGLLLLFMGIGSFIGSPLAGFLYDQTGTFNLSFYVMGTLISFSGLLGIPLPYINAWEKNRQKFSDAKLSSSMEKTPSVVVYHANDNNVARGVNNLPETLTEEEEDNNNTHL